MSALRGGTRIATFLKFNRVSERCPASAYLLNDPPLRMMVVVASDLPSIWSWVT
jgi:hypothetical protein